MQQCSTQIIPDPSDTDQTSDSNLAISEDPSESETESSLESSISSSDSKNLMLTSRESLWPNLKRPSLPNPQELTHFLNTLRY